MSKYLVEIPIAGSIAIEVDADNRDDAMERAWNRYREDGPDAFEVTWEALDAISSGNVCHAPCRRISADEIDD